MISKDEVLKSAALAKLRLTEEEEKRFADELAAIVRYVDQLKEVDMEAVGEIGHPIGLENAFREDEAQPDARGSLEGSASINQAPKIRDGYLVVPRIFSDL